MDLVQVNLFYYFDSFFIPTKSSVFFPSVVRPTAMMRIREIHIAVKRERRIPSPSMRPNPLMSEIPNI